MNARMTKKDLIAYFWTQPDRDLRFIANVITCHCDNVTQKLRALYSLVQRGHDIRAGNTIDTFRLEGEQLSLFELDGF